MSFLFPSANSLCVVASGREVDRGEGGSDRGTMIVDEFSPVESPSTTCAEQEQVFLNDDEVPIDFLRLSEEDATEVAIDACVADNSPLLRALSKRSPNFNPSRNDRDGDAPVHYAVSCKSSDCLLALLEARADATSRSSDGSNCLHIAAQ